ncbi:MAG: hypothetical protein EXS16_15150 [Gemmataceae bacterium]|nr:hypothetical protein [Gemmataceae bacterium]
MLYEDWGQRVSQRFPLRDPGEARCDWERLKQTFPVGQLNVGTVIAKAPFGAWLDIGVGFPALLLIPDIDGLTPGQYESDNWGPIGSTIEVVVGIYNDKSLTVRVWPQRTDKK